jgi:hypothetical protein
MTAHSSMERKLKECDRALPPFFAKDFKCLPMGQFNDFSTHRKTAY